MSVETLRQSVTGHPLRQSNADRANFATLIDPSADFPVESPLMPLGDNANHQYLDVVNILTNVPSIFRELNNGITNELSRTMVRHPRPRGTPRRLVQLSAYGRSKYSIRQHFAPKSKPVHVREKERVSHFSSQSPQTALA